MNVNGISLQQFAVACQFGGLGDSFVVEDCSCNPRIHHVLIY